MSENPKFYSGIQKVGQSNVSRVVIAEVAVAMTEGALKYGRHNYRVIPVRASTYFDAANRHLDQWWEGEDIDPDSKLSHITKAITSLITLRDAMIHDCYIDDRPPSLPEGWMNEYNEAVKALNEKYPVPVEPYKKKNDE